MTDRELLRAALDALIEPGNWDKRTQAFEALRDRLEQWDALDKMVAENQSMGLYEEVPCKDHPDAPHGYDRNASHSEDRYVCECENWEPPEPEPVAWMFQHSETGNVTFLDNLTMAKLFNEKNVRWGEAIPLYAAPPKEKNE